MILDASANWETVLRQDVIPVLSGYLVFLGAELAYARSRAYPRPSSSATGRSPELGAPLKGWRDFARHLASIVLPGYLVFLAIVVVFYFVLGDQPRSFIPDVLGEGALLTFVVVVPGFVILTLLHERLLGQRRRTPRSPR
jgi:Family of unknown function (DUF6256)